jgi:hypothetical protein
VHYPTVPAVRHIPTGTIISHPVMVMVVLFCSFAVMELLENTLYEYIFYHRLDGSRLHRAVQSGFFPVTGYDCDQEDRSYERGEKLRAVFIRGCKDFGYRIIAAEPQNNSADRI